MQVIICAVRHFTGQGGWTRLICGLLFCVFSSFSATPAVAQKNAISPALDLDSAAPLTDFAWAETRAHLLPGSFVSDPFQDGPLPLSAFLPVGGQIAKGEMISGTLVLKPTELSLEAMGALVGISASLPEKTLGIITHGDRIVPVPAFGSITIDVRRPLTMIFGVGRVWRESGDGGRSRALLPVSLINSRTGAVRNGLAAFLYGDGGPASDMIVQFSQETASGREANLWGRIALSFEPGSVEGAQSRIAAYEERVKSAPKYRDWQELADMIGGEVASRFDGPLGDKGAVSASGLVVDDTVYLKGCITRHGPYPFCRQMRHGVQGMSTSFLGFMAAAHIANRFGQTVLSETVGNLVPELRDHPQWARVRLRDILNMASGLGEIEPERSAVFVQADGDPAAQALRAASTVTEKLAVARKYPFYPWSPGAVFRFRLSDSFVLSLALDRLVKAELGPEASLWSLLHERFLKAIGIARLQMRMIVDDSIGTLVPDLGEGLFPTTGDAVRLILTLRRSAGGSGLTGLSKNLVADTLTLESEIGLPTGIRHVDGPGRYHMGFWRTPVRMGTGCVQYLPSSRGRGGTIISFMPYNVTAFRFADGAPDDPVTGDSTDLRRVGHAVRGFCGEQR